MRTTCSERSIRRTCNDAVSNDDIERDLSQCLLAETKAVAKVCTEIISWTGQLSSVKSWRNPNQSVYPFEILRDIAEDDNSSNYTLRLEKYLEVIHTFFRLASDYLNTLPLIRNDFIGQEVGIAGRKMSLPALVGTLWARLQMIGQDVYSRTNTQLSSNVPIREVKITGCQTDQTSLGCEICRITASAVQSLVTVVSKHCQNLEGNKLTTLKKEMKSEVFDISQWSAMNKWCSALQNDVSILSVHCKQLASSNKLSNAKLKELENEKVVVGKKLNSLIEQREEIAKNSSKGVEVRAKLCKRLSELEEHLQQKDKECNEANLKIKKLEEELENRQRQYTEKQQSSVKERLQNSDLIRKFKLKSDENEKLVVELQKRNEMLSQEIFALRDESSQRENDLLARKEYVASLETKLTDATAKISRLEEELKEEKSHAAEIWRKLNENQQAVASSPNVDAISKKLEALEEHIYSSIPTKKRSTE